MERLSVLCFAGTYALALACDLARFLVRGSARWYATLALTALGWLVQTAYLGHRAWAAGELPVGTVFESLLVLSWIVVAIDLYWELRSPRPVAVGVFLLPLVLGVLAAAARAPRTSWTRDGWEAFWGTVHGLLLVGGAVGTVVAFASGLMYLVQADRLKNKRPARLGVILPSLEQSERWNRAAITLGVSAPHLRVLHRRGPDDRRAAVGRGRSLVDRPEGRGHRRVLAGVRGAPARAVSPRLAGHSGDGAHGGGVWVPGVRDGGRRRDPAHGARGLGHGGSAVKLLALGVDHRSAPTAIREALAFDGPRRELGLDALRAAFPGAEFAVLSTCNRVEVYAASELEDAALNPAALTGWLAGFHDLAAVPFAAHLVAHHDDAVVAHLFRVASSLESLVLGEGQILGQVRDAYQAAVAQGTVGPILHDLFRNALRVGKLVRAETGLDQGRLSVASVAVDVAREVFDQFADKTVLVIGAGKMADLTLQHLATLKPGRILVANRNPDRAAKAAERWGGKPVPFETLHLSLIEADVVVSTTAADEPIVTKEQYARVLRARRNRLSLILDIAVPRDFEPEVGELDRVMLYNVDDLRAQVEQNMLGRKKGVEPAKTIIERETAACLANLRHGRRAGALLRQLGDYADAVRMRELERFHASCPDLTDAQREAVAHLVHRLQNQILHHPRSALRSAARRDDDSPYAMLNAVRHLFGLGDAD